jgi:hypothetical protein
MLVCTDTRSLQTHAMELRRQPVMECRDGVGVSLYQRPLKSGHRRSSATGLLFEEYRHAAEIGARRSPRSQLDRCCGFLLTIGPGLRVSQGSAQARRRSCSPSTWRDGLCRSLCQPEPPTAGSRRWRWLLPGGIPARPGQDTSTRYRLMTIGHAATPSGTARDKGVDSPTPRGGRDAVADDGDPTGATNPGDEFRELIDAHPTTIAKGAGQRHKAASTRRCLS